MNYDREYSLDMLQSLLGRALHELEIGFPVEDKLAVDRLADSLYSRIEVMLMEVSDALIELNSDVLAKEAVKSKTDLERIVESWVWLRSWEAGIST